MNALKHSKLTAPASHAQARQGPARWRPVVPRVQPQAPAFLVRLVGKHSARHLTRDAVLEPHHD